MDFKDTVAWTIIYGGGAVVNAGIFAAAVAAGLMTRGQVRAVNHATFKTIAKQKEKMWQAYKSTGKISSIFEALE